MSPSRANHLLCCLALLVSTQKLTTNARSLTDGFRCSHVPPAPADVSHVVFDRDQFETVQDTPPSNKAARTEVQYGAESKLQKRHISDSLSASQSDQSPRGPLWNVLSKLEQTLNPNQDQFIPMKVYIHYDSSVNSLDKPKIDLITNVVMPTVVKYFESVLAIRKNFTIDRFRMARRCPNNTVYYAKDVIGLSRPYCMDRCEDYAICGEMVVPQDHLSACSYCNSTSKRCLTDYASEGPGVEGTQLLLYVSAKQTARCKKDQTIAYAAHCAQDSKTDRPVAGHANLCPSSISTDSKDLKALIATVKHELTHVLGFSVSLFAYYRDKYGNPLTDRDPSPGPIPVDPKTGYAKWSDRIIKRYVRHNWVTGKGKVDKEVYLVVTPTVVAEARRHFNCSSLEGAELEDQGSDGTSMTHWEKRLFENEAMTGTHTQNSVYSRLTLAVLQDTGWYVADFSRADKLDWGRNLGCDFVKKSCKSWIDEHRAAGQSINPFCDKIKGDLLQISCTEDRTSKAVCNMKQYSEALPEIYRNFNHLEGVAEDELGKYGGSVDLADYCPFVQEFTWQSQNVTTRGSRCDISNNNVGLDRNAALEWYGPQTKCFEHGKRWEQRSCVYKRHWHHFGAGCYRYLCANGHFSIMVGNHSYPCYYRGQQLRVEQLVDHWLYNGTIICPPCESICAQSKCKHFDKHLADKFMAMDNDVDVDGDEESLKFWMDESMNSVGSASLTRRQDSYKRKLSLDLTSSNNKSTTDDVLLSSLKEQLLRIFASQKRPAKVWLACSSSSSIGSSSALILAGLIWFWLANGRHLNEMQLSEICKQTPRRQNTPRRALA